MSMKAAPRFLWGLHFERCIIEVVVWATGNDPILSKKIIDILVFHDAAAWTELNLRHPRFHHIMSQLNEKIF